MVLSRAVPAALCLFAWFRLRAWRRRLKDVDSPECGNTGFGSVVADDADDAGDVAAPADPVVDAKAKKSTTAVERQAGRQRKLNMTAEEKAEERLRRDQEAAIKLERKCSHAAELRANLRDRLAGASAGLPVVLVAIDVEAWEQDGDKVTEIGLAKARVSFVDDSMIETLPSDIVFCHRHILIREHLTLRNGKHVADNKDYFLFGDSEVLSLADAVEDLASELRFACLIVGHAARGDLAWLRNIGVSGLEVNSSSLETRLVDTQTLAFSADGISVGSQPQLGLHAMANAYGLNPDRLHNGANDAAFTLQIMLSQCGVVFPVPQRRASKHRALVEYQAALAEAVASLDIGQREWLMHEQKLRAEVEMFARSFHADAAGLEACNNSDEWSGNPRVLRFPIELTQKERKIIHMAAEDFGLQSLSTEDGPNGERRVSIFRPGAMSAADLANKPGGKKPKTTRSQRKWHCKASDEERLRKESAS